MSERPPILVLTDNEMRISSSGTIVLFRSNIVNRVVISQAEKMFHSLGATSVKTDDKFKEKLDIFDYGDLQKDELIWTVTWEHVEGGSVPLMPTVKWSNN